MKKFQLSLISKYRDELFGLSIIAIIFFHFSCDFLPGVDKGLIDTTGFGWFVRFCYYFKKYIGSIGVELFLFLSGMGLYYSYSRNPDILNFYRKRFTRILIPYTIVGLPFWMIKRMYLGGLGFGRVIKDFFFVTFFTDGVHTLWFIGLICVLYLLYPLFHRLLADSKYSFIWFILLLVLSYMIPQHLYVAARPFYRNTQIAITRFCIFIIGCYMGKFIKKGSSIPYIGVIVLFAVSFYINFYACVHDFPSRDNRYTDVIFALGLLPVGCAFLNLFRESNILMRFLRFVGSYSLELYLTHVTLRNLMKPLGFHAYDPVQFGIMLLLSMVLSYFIHKIKLNKKPAVTA